MRLVLYQPEIPQNTGTLMRLGACLGVGIDIIDPCGFVWNDTRLRRAGMDYKDRADINRYPSWEDFTKRETSRLILLDTKASVNYLDFSFQSEDRLMVGRESCGVPDAVFHQVDHQVKIHIIGRSLNVAVAAAMVLGEMIRQNREY